MSFQVSRVPTNYYYIIIVLIIFMSGCGGDWRGFGNGFTNSSIINEGSATLNWQPPQTNVDGTPTNDIAGFVIYYGSSSGDYTDWVDVGNVLSYNITNLTSGTYYFAISAYDILGNESDLSNELSKEI